MHLPANGIDLSSPIAWLWIAALVLVTLGFVSLLRAGLNRLENPHSRRGVALLALGVIGLIAAQGWLWLDRPRWTSPLPPGVAFEHLVENRPVEWCVRMVAYDPANPGGRRIDQITHLGPPHELYSFVGDYAELRGYTAAEAVYKAGGELRPGEMVSAIIFPLRDNPLYPGNVRGVLQVIELIDAASISDANYQPARLAERLAPGELENLKSVSLQSWEWNNYRDEYEAFLAAFKRLKQDKISAFEKLGDIEPDWVALGYSRVVDRPALAGGVKLSLTLPGGGTVEAPDFGARAFLMKNLEVTTIPGRMMIEFDDPTVQRIPYIKLSDD